MRLFLMYKGSKKCISRNYIFQFSFLDTPYCTGLHGGKYMVFTHPLSYLRTHTKSALAYLRVYCNITTLTSHIGSNNFKTFTLIGTQVDQIIKGGRKKPH